MAMDKKGLADLDLEALERLRVELDDQIEYKRGEKRKQAVAQIHEIARGLGVNLDELLGYKKKRTYKERKPKDPNHVPEKREPRYRNPDNHDQTWVGMGHMPAWLKHETEVKHRPLEDFLIPGK